MNDGAHPRNAAPGFSKTLARAFAGAVIFGLPADTGFDFVPGRSSREAGLFFERDPGAFELRLGARSFQRP